MMNTKKMILILCWILSEVLCYASNVDRMENEKGEGIPILVKEITSSEGSDKSGCITPFINGHILTVTFNENFGRVSVEVTTISGISVQCLSVLTPNGVQLYIPNAGDYIVTFTLSNGDAYYGEFTVRD